MIPHKPLAQWINYILKHNISNWDIRKFRTKKRKRTKFLLTVRNLRTWEKKNAFSNILIRSSLMCTMFTISLPGTYKNYWNLGAL